MPSLCRWQRGQRPPPSCPLFQKGGGGFRSSGASACLLSACRESAGPLTPHKYFLFPKQDLGKQGGSPRPPAQQPALSRASQRGSRAGLQMQVRGGGSFREAAGGSGDVSCSSFSSASVKTPVWKHRPSAQLQPGFSDGRGHLGSDPVGSPLSPPPRPWLLPESCAQRGLPREWGCHVSD